MSTSSLAATDQEKTVVVEVVSAPLVLQMIPSVHHQQGRDDEQVQLATTMRSLVLDQKHPIALEIAGTDQQRYMLIRARNPHDLKHVETQLQARLPHAQFVSLVGCDDPFHMVPGETVSVVELHAGQASYLPLQEYEQMKNGEDPILGLLGALDALPSDLRAIAQLALVPASPTWSRSYQRKALEHALEPERQHDRQKQTTARDEAGAPSTIVLVLGALFLAGYFLFPQFPKMLPIWVPTTIQTLLQGKWQQVLSGPHHLDVEATIGGLLLLLLIPLMLQRVWKRLFQGPLYDMRSVAEKTSRSAYHVRLRLYVIGPGATTSPKTSIWCRMINIRTDGEWAVWQRRWMMDLRMAASLSKMWFWGFVSLLRARRWKHATKALSILFLLGGRGFLFPGKRITATLSDAWKRRWQNWRDGHYQQERRSQILARLTAAYRQYHLANGNYFVPKRVGSYRTHSWVSKGTWWKGVQHSRHMFDVQALSALWHIPADGALPDLAHLAYRRSRSRLLPPGLQSAQQEQRIGYSEHAGHRIPFGLPADCLQSHLLIGGKSGEGKSTLMQHLALRSMKEQHGLVVIDPHGDLVEQILTLVPPDRIEDVVLLDLSDEHFACGLNPIDATISRGRDKAISDLIKILSNIWGTAWGSRMEIAFEYALRTLYEANKILCKQGKAHQQYTLLDVMPILTDESFCHALLEQIEDVFIRRWWATYYDPLSVQMQRDRIDPVLSKVAKFESTIARRIVGQSLCSVNFTTCLEQKKIVLVKLAKGVIGEDVARILGATLLGFLNVALEEQGSSEIGLRKQVPILIDEFQTLDGVDWGALAELRKYGATFCLATQSLEYLREKKILPVVLANVKQMAIFRMSADDAWMVHRELDVDPEDIVHLDTLTCYLKLVHKRQQHPTFSLKLSFPPEGKKEQAQLIRTTCQRRYMRPASEIEAEIVAHLARQIGATSSGHTSKQTPETKIPHKEEGHARQDGGNRGRKAQAKTSHPEVSDSLGGEITAMNWQETVGSPENSTDEEREEDLDDHTEESDRDHQV